MTDLEISKALALAIGWKPEQISVDRWSLDGGKTWEDVGIRVKDHYHKFGRGFSYRDWNVIGPIAKKYKLEVDFGLAGACSQSDYCWYYRDTVEEAIAACVIGAKK